MVVHKDYQDRSPYPNDIALLRLASPAVINQGVKLACLPLNSTAAASILEVDDLMDGLSGEVGTVVGWGRTEPFEQGHFPVRNMYRV